MLDMIASLDRQSWIAIISAALGVWLIAFHLWGDVEILNLKAKLYALGASMAVIAFLWTAIEFRGTQFYEVSGFSHDWKGFALFFVATVALFIVPAVIGAMVGSIAKER